LSVSFPADAEVIVVSDGGDQALIPDLSGLRDILKLNVLHVPRGGPALARNRGLEVARGAVVVFIDDDCLPEPEWLERLTTAVLLDPPVAAGGRTLNGLPSNPYAVAAQLVLDLVEKDQERLRYGPLFFPSNNLAFPTDALRRLSGFNPEFKTAEDRELCRRWLGAGYTLVRAQDAVLSHAPDLDLARFWRKFVAYGEGAAQFHRGAGSECKRDIFAFHLRVPMLAARVSAEQRLGRQGTLAALVVLWEVANLVGFVKEAWNHGSIRQGEDPMTGVRA
jgi:glycosyltransferase involved in cell wall biosynthesis